MWTVVQAFGVFLIFAAAVFVALCLYGFFALIQCRILRTRAEAEAQVIIAHHEPVPDTFTLSLRQTAPVRHVQSVQALADVAAALIPHHEWWPNVHNYHSHMDLVGPNTSGKTTLATAILAERAKTDKILICDPHRKFNQWADLPAIGVGRDFAAIEHAIQAVYQEFHRRFQPDESVDEPLTIFLDEYPSYPLHIPSVIPLIKQMLRESPKAGIRLVMLAQEPNGKIWGFDGEAAIRKNLMHILLGEFAAEVDHLAAAQQYPAVLKRHGKTLPLDVSRLPELSRQAVDPSALWVLPQGNSQVTAPVTAEHAQVAYWLSIDPTLSAREVARRLWPTKSSGGKHAQAAGRIMQEVRAVTVTQVPVTGDFEEE